MLSKVTDVHYADFLVEVCFSFFPFVFFSLYYADFFSTLQLYTFYTHTFG